VLAAEDGSFHVGVHDGLEGGVLPGDVGVEETISSPELRVFRVEVL